MRLLCVEQKTVWGGGQVALVNLLQEWRTTRADIVPTIVCPPDAELVPRVRALKIPCETFDPGIIDKRRGVGWNFAQRIGPSARLIGMLRRTRAEVVLANGAFSFLASVLPARLARVPVLWLEHNTTLPNDAILQRMIGWADCIVVVSAAIETQFLALGCPRDKLAVIYNGVDTSLFHSSPSPDRRPSPVVGTVSRLSPEKGVEYFVQAAYDILRELPETRFLVVGDGPLRSELEARAPHPQMRFVGAQENVADWLNDMDVFVMPSLAEAFGLAVVEAMACELPVVASDVGGLREIVVEGATGLRVPPRDSVALARGVLELLRDNARREAFGKAGRARVQEKFTLERQAREMEEALEAITR